MYFKAMLVQIYFLMELDIFLSPEYWLFFIVKKKIYIASNDGVDDFNRIYSDFLKVWLTSMWEIK